MSWAARRFAQRRWASRRPPSGIPGGNAVQMKIAGLKGLGITVVIGGWWYVYQHMKENLLFPVEVDELTEDLRYLLKENPEAMPLLIRLVFCQNAVHIFNKSVNVTSANTASLRYFPNAAQCKGFTEIVTLLDEARKIYPAVGVMDIWTLSACIAIEELGGPPVVRDWEFGRIDSTSLSARNETSLLPMPNRHGEPGCLKNLVEFMRMGFTIQEVVCLMGAHTVGGMHKDISGYSGEWTKTPKRFTNEYFVNLKNLSWRVKNRNTAEAQYEAGGCAMLPADVALLQNDETYKYVKKYAESEKEFHEDFRKAWKKLTDLNMSLRLQDPSHSYKSYPSAIIFTLYGAYWAGRVMSGYSNVKTENVIENQESIDYIKGRLMEL